MKWIHRLMDLSRPEELQQIRTEDVLFAFDDQTVRKLWLHQIYAEILRINLEVDKRLTRGKCEKISDLAERRQALQWVLETVLTAKRLAKGNNPKLVGEFDLDSVTVQPV